MGINDIEIYTETIKLEQFLKFVGITQTGGQVKFLIDERMILVNGQIADQRSMQLHHGDEVEIVGEETFIIRGEE